MSTPSPSGSPPADRLPEGSPPRRGNPWWIPPFLGRVPAEVDPSLLRILGLVTVALLFEQYDLSLMNATIALVARDLGVALGDVGWLTASVRLGGVVTFLIVPFADRLGRRRILLLSLLGMTAGAVATALAQSPAQYVVAQLGSRAFMLTASAVGFVIVSEEMPAAHRGWAIGTLVAVSSFGYGIGTTLFAFVNALPFGWRALYVVGVGPALLVPFFRRALRETRRFSAHRETRERPRPGLRGWLEPVLHLARTEPVRTLAVGVVGLGSAAGSIAVFQFLIFLVKDVHGGEEWQFSVLVIGAGLLGIAGNTLAGRLADRIGRRRVGFAAFALYPLAAFALYNGPAWSLPLSWVFVVLFGTAGEVVMRAVSTELFPTSHRSTAVGWLFLLQTVGWSIGLAAIGSLHVDARSLGPVVGLASGLVAVAGSALLLLPESRGLELETVAGS